MPEVMDTTPGDVEPTFEEWGDGRVVAHFGDEGEWIMFDPETDTVDVTNHR